MPTYYFKGESTPSAFRIKKLLNKIQAIHPRITTLRASSYYHVTTQCDINQHTQKMIAQWLQASIINQLPSSSLNNTVWYVCPRPGTISPWSSKAMDIACQCQLNHLKHIEHWTCYMINSTTDTDTLEPKTRDAIQSLMYDPLIETLISEPYNTLSVEEKNHENTKKQKVS